MRFDKIVRFYKSGNGGYDPDAMSYDDSNELVLETSANVTQVGIDRGQQTFGSMDIERLTVRIRESLPVAWSFLMVDDDETHYKQTTTREPLKANTVIVEKSVNNE